LRHESDAPPPAGGRTGFNRFSTGALNDVRLHMFCHSYSNMKTVRNHGGLPSFKRLPRTCWECLKNLAGPRRFAEVSQTIQLLHIHRIASTSTLSLCQACSVIENGCIRSVLVPVNRRPKNGINYFRPYDVVDWYTLTVLWWPIWPVGPNAILRSSHESLSH